MATDLILDLLPAHPGHGKAAGSGPLIAVDQTFSPLFGTSLGDVRLVSFSTQFDNIEAQTGAIVGLSTPRTWFGAGRN